ncbi:MAG: EAL domain-containing protein [Candidatus Competibacteraceae bacterium]|nr:EAL domain-containing protein [Candidatus Competibacteraceae bacterium]HRY15959.1 EAL domain-containing protein [Candidatus Competibacteraceae bacterium]
MAKDDLSGNPFYLLFHQAPVGYLVLDNIGLIRGANETFCRMVDQERDQLIGRSLAEYVSGVERGIFLARYRALFRNPAGQNLETFIQSARRSTFYAHLQGVRINTLLPCWQVDNRSLLLLAVTDLTEHKRAEERLRLAATVFETSTESIMITDSHGIIKAVNGAFTKTMGYELREIIGQNPRIFKSGRMPTEYYARLWRTLIEVGYWEGEIWNRRKNGKIYQEWLTITAVQDSEGQNVEYVAIFSDITRRRLSTEEIYYQAHYDSLTRLPNRNLLLERLGQAIQQNEREPRKFALLFIDLDHFKKVNETLGLIAGDRLLQETAQRLFGCVRISDTVARQMGDEFAVLLWDIERSTDAAQAAAKILAALDQPFDLDDQSAHVSASIGITLFPDDGWERAQLFRNADLAMHRAKEAGRNTFQFFEPAMTEAVLARRTLETDFRHALEHHDEFMLFLQPIINLNDRRISGFEVLSRWRRRGNELVPPDRFIPLAEESGLIHDFSRWMLIEACRWLAAFKTEALHPNLAVNLSSRQIPNRLSLDWLDATLAEYQLSPIDLTLEITEGVLLADSPATRTWLAEARQRGFRISLDDFGTGYSSLAYLKNFPLDRIKIDKSFIHDIENRTLDQALVRAILAMTGELGLEVVAEGIETNSQLLLLQEMGCSYGQGYGIAPPMPAPNVIGWVRSFTQ